MIEILKRANNDVGVSLKLQSWKVRDRVALWGVAAGGEVTVRGGCGEGRRSVPEMQIAEAG